MGRVKRARSEEQKDKRRETIMACALKLFEGKTFQNVGVADVAKRAGIAKGTFFLYFKTKEELFFSIIRREFQSWLDDMDRLFEDKRNLTKEELLTLFAMVLGDRYLLAKLIAIQYTVLEHNVGYSEILKFKHMMIERLTRTGRLLEKCSPVISPGRGFQLLMWMYAMVIGIFQTSEPSPVLKRIYMKEPGMNKFQMNFKEEYFEMLGAILGGWAKSSRKQSKKRGGDHEHAV
jgi:TetR/AcrR family transcriptional regulator